MSTIWIDITNSPHVLLMEPVIRELNLRGYKTIVTARDFSSTYMLLDKKGIKYKKIGKHGGKRKLKKALQLVFRDIRLYFYLKNKNITLALGQASYDSAIVAKILGIPSVTTFDYEFADTILRVLLRHVTYALVPKYISKESLEKYRIDKENIIHYDGLKEEIYLYNFNPDKSEVEKYIKEEKINILIRPAAENSEYYRGITAHIIDQICDYLSVKEEYNVNIAPRTEEQGRRYKEMYPKFTVLLEAFDGPQLIYWSDCVISSGGTMIREAAALGTLAISSTDLQVGQVDNYLIGCNRLYYTADIEEFKKITIMKRKKTIEKRSGKILKEFVDVVESVIIS